MGTPFLIDSSSASTNAVGATVTCNYPARSNSGDLLVMSVAFRRSTASAYTVATPSGWTLLNTEDNSASSGLYGATFWRFRGAETSVAPTASLGTLMYGSVMIHAYQGDIDQTTPIDTSASAYSTATAAAKTTPSVTTATNNCRLALFVHTTKVASGSTVWTAPVNEYVDAYAGTAATLLMTSGGTIQRAAGSTGTRTATISATTAAATFSATVAIRPGGTNTPGYIDSVNQQSASATTATYNYPTVSQSGDLMILVASTRGSAGAKTFTTPAGWTLLNFTDSYALTPGGSGSYVYWRFRGAETSVTYTASVAVIHMGSVIAIDGASVDPTSPISDNNFAINMAGSASIPTPSVTPTIGNIVVMAVSYDGSGAVRTVTWDNKAGEVGDSCSSIGGTYVGTSEAVVPNPANNTATGSFTNTVSASVLRNTGWSIAVQPTQAATVNGTDTAVGSDTASVIATTSIATDSGAGTESASIKPLVTSDTGLGTEAASVIAVSPAATDSGTGTDTAVANAVVFATDSATAVDVAFVKNTVLVSDSATAVDTAQITTQGSDTGSSVDTATGIGLDSGTGVDTASVIIGGAVDTAFASESAFVSNTTLPTPDTATAVEQPATVAVKVTDTGTAAESVSTTANVPATDSAIATESAKVIIQGAVDSGNAVESAKIVQSVSDSAHAVDIATIIVTVFGVDTGVALDIAAVMVSGSDGGTAVDTAFKFVSGQILSARVTRIAKDLRITLIEREPRTIQIEAQARKTIIGFEDRRVIKVASESREFSISAEA